MAKLFHTFFMLIPTKIPERQNTPYLASLMSHLIKGKQLLKAKLLDCFRKRRKASEIVLVLSWHVTFGYTLHIFISVLGWEATTRIIGYSVYIDSLFLKRTKSSSWRSHWFSCQLHYGWSVGNYLLLQWFQNMLARVFTLLHWLTNKSFYKIFCGNTDVSGLTFIIAET